MIIDDFFIVKYRSNKQLFHVINKGLARLYRVKLKQKSFSFISFSENGFKLIVEAQFNI